MDTAPGRAGPTNLLDGLFVGPSHSEDTTVPTVVPYRTPERRTGDVGKGAASVFFALLWFVYSCKSKMLQFALNKRFLACVHTPFLPKAWVIAKPARTL